MKIPKRYLKREEKGKEEAEQNRMPKKLNDKVKKRRKGKHVNRKKK